MLHGPSRDTKELCGFCASFNVTYYCCACACQSSVIMIYFSLYVSSRFSFGSTQFSFGFISEETEWKEMKKKKKMDERKCFSMKYFTYWGLSCFRYLCSISQNPLEWWKKGFQWNSVYCNWYKIVRLATRKR